MFQDNELFRILHHGVQKGQKYPKKTRHFCLALIYYSPRAYEFVRKAFNNHLPHIKTIRNWFSNSDIRSEPGLQADHLARLKKIADDYELKHNRKLMCSFVFDEMFVRRQICWSLFDLDCSGFVNYGEDPTKQDNTIAKAAIVFILKGFDTNFEFPIAYYFIHDLTATQRKSLVQDIISAVTQSGIKITNMTFDGLAANAKMCSLFGANLNVYHKHCKTYILNPITNEKIYVILDPCHMVKLIRNTLGRKEEFFVGNKKEKISMKFIVALYEYSRKNDLHSHKLTRMHIEWQRNPMNVRLAVQTFSDSVANTLQFLMEQKIPEFQKAEATIDFIRRMDKLFDIFNSKNSKPTSVFKRALTAENKRIIFDFLRDNIKYLKSLKIEQQYFEKDDIEEAHPKIKLVLLLKSRSFCGFRGLIIDMISLMEMYTDFIEQNHLLTSIATYNMLQDVIEMFFGRLRACGGFNNNPNFPQFKGMLSN